MKLNLSLLTKFSKICLYLILFLLVYSILHFIFPSLVIFSIPFWSWGIFQTLATLSIGFGIVDTFQCQRIIKLITNYDFLNLASTMDSIQKIYSKYVYDYIMESCHDIFLEKSIEYDKKNKKQFKNHEHYTEKLFKSIINKEKTWKYVYEDLNFKQQVGSIYKYLINDYSKEEKDKIESELNLYKKLSTSHISLN